jgi:hypothetical protein
MRKTILPISVLLASLLLPSAAAAQLGASASIRLDLPVVLPPLVVVSPGVQVVPDIDQEVFLVNGVYWTRQDGGWYRSRSHRGGWVYVPGKGVPARLATLEPGRYRRWKGPHHDNGVRDHGRGEGRGGVKGASFGGGGPAFRGAPVVKGGGPAKGGGGKGDDDRGGKHGGKHGKH